MPRLESPLRLNRAAHRLMVALFLLALFYWLFAWCALPGYAAPAIPTAPGAIIGTVTTSDGQPLAAVRVYAYQYRADGNPQWGAVRTATTNAAGAYRLSLLAAGLYRLKFVDLNDRYIARFYPAAMTVEAATDIPVAGNEVTGLDLQLALGGAITGAISVVDPPLSNPIELSIAAKLGGEWQHWGGRQLPATATAYRIGGLPTGLYRVCLAASSATPPYDRSACYDDIRSGRQNATPITVTAGVTVTAIDFHLGDRGDLAQLMGVVTNAAGQPLPDIDVTVAITPYYDLSPAYYTKTNAAGYYHFDALLPATYTLQLVDHTGAYAMTYFGDAALAADATLIRLAQYDSRTIDFTLRPGASITGVVTVAGEVPATVYPQVYLQTKRGWEELAYVHRSTVDNHYRLAGLPPGRYRLGSVALLGEAPGTPFSGFYGGATLAAATTFALAEGEVKPNLNFDLPGVTLDGQIRGRVTTAGAPLANIRVELYNDMDPGEEYPPFWYQLDGATGSAHLASPEAVQRTEDLPLPELIVYTMTNAAGDYRLEGIPNGGYVIRFVDRQQRYADSVFNSGGLYRYAETLYLKNGVIYHADGSTLATVDGELVLGGTLKGQVRLANGQGVAGATLNVVAIAQGMATTLLYIITTDANGFYELKSIYPTQYRISAFKPELGYPWCEYYGAPDDASCNEQKAALVTVTAEATTAGIDVVLGPDPKLFLPVVAGE